MTPTLVALDCFVFRAPIVDAVANAFGAMTDRPAAFLRLRASDGIEGWGEVFCNFPQVGAEHRARLATSLFAPLVHGQPCADPQVVRALLDRRTRQMAIQSGEPGPFAQVSGAIDQALWDMAARRAGVPLWKHLGAAEGRVRVYASGIGPERVVEIALAKRDAGYRAWKLKVGFGAERDRANMAALRAALGDDATIMVDANQAWSPEDAPARIAELAPFHPHWIEEPIMADHPLPTWSALAAASPVPLAAGENIRGLPDFVAALDNRHLGFVQPDVGKWGGISGCSDVAAHAGRRGVTFCPHWLAGGVGLAASMHLLAAAGGPESYAEVDANPNPLREEVFPMQVRDGWVSLPDAPGLGVAPDLEALRPLRVV